MNHTGRRQLHVRAALMTLSLMLLLCIVMLVLFRHYNARSSLESTQRMNLGLARYILDHQPAQLLDTDDKPRAELMHEIAMHVMMINSSVEVYLLDVNGQILSHALDLGDQKDPVGRRVNLARVQALLTEEPDSLRLPIFGDDPRSIERDNIVSIATLGSAGKTSGYLYVVLNGQRQQNVTATLANSNALREMVIGLSLAVIATMALTMAALYKVTRPLRELTHELTEFRSKPDHTPVGERGDEIRILRDAIHAMQARIAHQFKRIEDADNHRRELISNISHDLRTPLSSIQGYVETVLLRGDQLCPAQRAEHLKTALVHVQLLGRRIGDLFQLSKLDAGRVEPKYETFCLAELLQDVVQNYRLGAQQRGISLRLSAGSYMKTQVSADIALIERVLQNLIDNALRHTPSGGEVSLSLDASGPLIEVCVSDTGRGIASNHLPFIFERYWQNGSIAPGDAPRGLEAGSGLGLAIVKRILDLHGSVVNVRSALACGTEVKFGLRRVS